MAQTYIDPTQILGGGSGGSGVNYISNGNAEVDTTGWATYADAAQATPVDGTGGSPNVTWTRSATTPLRGLGSFIFTKDAANRQGQGASYDFTIDNELKNSVVQIQFYYLPSSTYVNQELTVYIYDVTNAQIIQPGGYLINDIHSPGKWIGTFQSTSSTSYRLIFHVAGTSATAYTVQMDDISVGPQVVQYGAPISDWQSYTPTTQGLGTINPYNIAYRRVGDSIEVIAKFLTGTVTASEARFGLPPGYSIDSTKITSIQMVSPCARESATAGNIVCVLADSGGPTYFNFATWSNAGSPYVKANGNALFGNSEQNSFHAIVPVTGLSSAVVMSNDTDTRVVSAQYNTPTGSITGSFNKITFTGKFFDTHNAYSSGTYTVPVPGKYAVYSVTTLSWTSWVSGNGVALAIFKNGTRIVQNVSRAQTAFNDTLGCHVSGIIECNAGDTIEIHVAATVGPSFAADAPQHSFSVQRISGPASIAATETVACRYYLGANQNIGDNALTRVNYDTKVFDSHGAFNTSINRFTAPVAGIYEVNACAEWNAGAFLDSGTSTFYLYKNGVADGYFDHKDQQLLNTRTGAFSVHGTVVTRLLAGDYVECNLYQANNGGTRSLNAGSPRTFMSVHKVGNYV